MATKLPYIRFYPGDWLRDQVSGCSLEAQGLWLRMMLLAHDSDRYGYLSQNGSPIPSDQVAKRCGCRDRKQYDALLGELFRAGVPSRDKRGVIYSRRMVRDYRLLRESQKYGSRGGNPLLLGGKNRGGLTPGVNPRLTLTSESDSPGKGSGGRVNGHQPQGAAERRKAAFRARLQETGGNGR